ncbi:beta family protein [Escherichia coli]|nr:beta family protein [Escherichia coli]
MSQHQYYPQLKWKPAEYESLMLLDQTTLSGFTPIITIPDIDWDYENECYKKSLSSYLSDFGINLAASWKANRPVLLDVKYLDKHGSSRHHPLDMCIQDARVNGKEIIPVVSPAYSTNYIHAVQRNLINGLAISITPQTWHQFTSQVNHLNIHPSLIDVIIDFGDIQNATDSLKQQALSMVNTLSGQAPWRNLILSSTAYPASQAGIPQHQVHHIPRHEYDLWMYVVQNFSNGRTPSFSDYPTASSTITSVDPRFMSQYVSVRYSNDTSWIFVKGTAVKGNGWGQTKNLCTTLVSSPEYQVFGSKFSWGDDYIYQRSLGANKSGGSKEWRKVAHTHHITLVVRQLYWLAQTQPAKP